MVVHCPLSHSNQVTLLDSFLVADLIRLYQRRLHVSISQEFGDLQQIQLYHCPESDLRFFYPAIAGSSSLYQQLQQWDWYYPDTKPEYDFACEWIRPGDKVLEVGSGRGAFAKQIPSQDYLGLELSQTAQQMAQTAGIRVLNQDLTEHARHYPATYDVVCAFQVLEHVSDVRTFVQDCLTCLQPGGYLIFSVPSADSFGRYVCNLVLDFPPHHLTRWSDQALRQLTTYFPLELVQLWHEPLQPAHHQMYLETLVQTALKTQLGWSMKPLDAGWFQRLLSGTSRAIAHLLVPGLNVPGMKPQGISVTAVYRKLPLPTA